ncbi:hypothetical protein [Aquitalea sp. LB_tupeE]|uniref:hypothetical protein n=1 Tax=Aquitalea sp. LB_tupeE TaxID=2748078 RepID=UPI0015B862B6|nr:hypothetical protein [Aquitalea sp. LB_tupeE]NWK78913.1 hypothetical protein [Aquitalea sp. LB_tupeE]
MLLFITVPLMDDGYCFPRPAPAGLLKGKHSTMPAACGRGMVDAIMLLIIIIIRNNIVKILIAGVAFMTTRNMQHAGRQASCKPLAGR